MADELLSFFSMEVRILFMEAETNDEGCGVSLCQMKAMRSAMCEGSSAGLSDNIV